jgi:SRSO17 transposase
LVAGTDRHLLIRRSITSGEMAYYLCWSPRAATLAELAVAGARWAVEECIRAAENEAALDHYQVRRHVDWYRYVTLAMCAHAWLAVTAAGNRPVRCPAAGPATAARPER